jgi:poly(A) polymerase Pap1
MVKHFHTLASHALELNGSLCRHLVRLQFQIEPQKDIQHAQYVLDELQKMVRDLQAELKTNNNKDNTFKL